MRTFLACLVCVLIAEPASAQLFFRRTCYREQQAQSEIAALRYQMMADQQRQGFETMRLQLLAERQATTVIPQTFSQPPANVSQSVSIYLVTPQGQVIPQTVPLVVDRPTPPAPSPIIVDRQPAPTPQPIILQGIPQTIPIAPPQQVIPIQPPQQYIPIQPPQQVVPILPPQQVIPIQPPQQYIPIAPPQQVIPIQPPPQVTPIQPPAQRIEINPPATIPLDRPQVVPLNPSRQAPRGYQTFTRARPITSRPLHQ